MPNCLFLQQKKAFPLRSMAYRLKDGFAQTRRFDAGSGFLQSTSERWIVSDVHQTKNGRRPPRVNTLRGDDTHWLGNNRAVCIQSKSFLQGNNYMSFSNMYRGGECEVYRRDMTVCERGSMGFVVEIWQCVKEEVGKSVTRDMNDSA